MDGCGWAMCSKDVYFCFDRGILLLAARLPCTELVELMRCNGAVAPVGDMCRQFVFLQKPMFFFWKHLGWLLCWFSFVHSLELN